MEVDGDLVRKLAHMARTSDRETSTAAERVYPTPLAARAAEDAEGLTTRLRREATLATSPRRAAALFYELGRLYEERLDRRDEALQAYRDSHQRFPGLTVNSRALVRLLRLAQEHAACLPVLEAELSGTSSSEEQVAILAERAAIRSRFLDDVEGACEDLTRALRISPHDPVVLDGLARIFRQQGAAGELEALLQRRSRLAETPALRSAILCQAARIRESHLLDAAGAAALYQTALSVHPSNLLALRAVLRAARANRGHAAVARLSEALAESESGAAAGALLWEAARRHSTRLRDPAHATRVLQRAKTELPDNRALLVELADLYEDEKTWTELAATLDQAVACSGDPAESSVLAYRLGNVRASRLHDSDGAIAALRQAVTLSPDNIPARRLLGRLYSRHGRFDELVGLLSDELELFTDPDRRAATAYRIGELFETKIGDLPPALASYEQALSLQPGFRPAIRGASRVCLALGRFRDLVRIYENQLVATPSREEQIFLLRRIAGLWEKELADPAASLPAYERLVSVEPSNRQAVRALCRLYASGERHEELVRTLKTDADQTMDRWRRAALLVEAAEVQERRLRDPDAALSTHLEVLEFAPAHQPALIAAGRILHRSRRFDELLRLHRAEYEQTEDPLHRIWLLMKIGRLQREALDRPEEAALAYTEALNLSSQTGGGGTSQEAAAADQLVRIYRDTGRDAELLGLLSKLPLPPPGPAQSLHHRRMAEILQRGERPALAVEHLRRALAASDDDAAYFELAQLYAAIGDRQNLIYLCSTELETTRDPLGQVSVLHKLAHLYGLAEHDLEHAVETLERILEIDPHNPIALHQLEALLGRLQQWEKLAAVLELVRAPNEDTDYRLACALEIAALKEDRLDDLQGAAHASYEVLERHPTHLEALGTLERYYRTSGNVPGLIQTLSRLSKTAQVTGEQAAWLVSLASAHATSGETKRAADLFRLAAEEMPEYLPAARGWSRAAEAAGEWSGVAEALEFQARASKDAGRQAACLFEAGQTWHHRCGDQTRAIQCYRAVLESAPRHQGAAEKLAALHTSREEWSDLVRLMQQAADQAEDATDRKRTLARIADVQRSRLSDVVSARQTISLALEEDPDDLSLLSTLAELCRAEGDYASLAQVDQRLVTLTRDPVLLKALHFELGMLWEEKLHVSSKAIAQYRKVLEIDERDLGALTRLSDLLTTEKDWSAAAHATEILIQRDDDRNRVRAYHLRLAQLYADGFGNLKGAVDACRRALAHDPGDAEATERLAEMLTRARDLRGLNAHLASTLAVHRGRIERDPFRVASYLALVRVFSWQESPDRIFVVRSLLHEIGAEPEDDAFAARLRTASPAVPSRALTPEEIDAVLLHPDERGTLRDFLAATEATIRKVLPPAPGVPPAAEKVTPRSHPGLVSLLQRMSKALGQSVPPAFLRDVPLDQMTVEDAAAPVLLLSREVMKRLEDLELMFSISQLLARIRLGHTLYARLEPDLLAQTVIAILAVTCHSFLPPVSENALAELRAKLEKHLGKRLRRQLEPLSLDLSDRPVDAARWKLAMQHSEDRLALAACGDVGAAIRCIHRSELLATRGDRAAPLSASAGPRVKQIIAFSVGEEYLTLRERLGMADHS
jgi:tetratricopeptide (TPR) repeat protein